MSWGGIIILNLPLLKHALFLSYLITLIILAKLSDLFFWALARKNKSKVCKIDFRETDKKYLVDISQMFQSFASQQLNTNEGVSLV